MARMVRAAVQLGPRRLEIREFPRPDVGADDGLLRVERCGICGSDVEQYKGNLAGSYPSIPGHEILGTIDDVGERAAERWGVQPGDRVAVEIFVPCRACDLCLLGQYMACRNRRATYSMLRTDVAPGLWGGYAEYLYLHPNAILHKVRKDLPADLAVMFNPLGAGVRWALHYGKVQFGDCVLILGPGQRGLCALVAARAAGAGTVIVTGLSSDWAKLQLAREFGADYTIDVDSENTVERVQEITRGKGADVVLDVTPMATQPVKDALEAVRHGGRVVLAGLKGGRTMEFSSDAIIRKGATIVGAYGVDARAYLEAIRIIESEQFPLARMHTHTFPLDDVAQAIEKLAGEGMGEQAVHVTIAPNAG